jgi:hypothetical protein
VNTGRAILKRGLGDNAFDDDGPRVGSFWTIPETRPYMRVLQAIVRLGFESGSYEAAAVRALFILHLLCLMNTISMRGRK